MIRRSSLPNDSAASARSVRCLGSETSPGIAITCLPYTRNDRAAVSNASAPRAVRTRSYPCFAKNPASSAPRPRLAPVINATCSILNPHIFSSDKAGSLVAFSVLRQSRRHLLSDLQSCHLSVPFCLYSQLTEKAGLWHRPSGQARSKKKDRFRTCPSVQRRHLNLQLDHAPLHSDGYGLCAVSSAQFGQNGPDVELGGALSDPQLGRDLLILEALRQQAHYFHFPGRD